MKDLVIGCADLYDWSKVKVWAKSIKDSGFTGDVVLLCYRVSPDILIECEKLGIHCYDCNSMPDGSRIIHDIQGKNTISHQLRFYHIWRYLEENEYSKVIITDVRDVLFQKNPSDFKWVGSDMFFPSEGITYGNEPWNMNNLKSAYPEFITNEISNWTVFNVGTLIGHYWAIKELCKLIYIMGNGRTIPNDQAAFNILANGSLLDMQYDKCMNNNGWACQCGISLDPEKSYLIPLMNANELLPKIVDGKVYNSFNQQYFLVHQYDRVPELRGFIEKKYD